jgi:hypothetical protein
VGVGFELRASHVLEGTLDPLLVIFSGYFGISRTVCPCWPPAVILLISVFQVAKITGVSHWRLTRAKLLNFTYNKVILAAYMDIISMIVRHY